MDYGYRMLRHVVAQVFRNLGQAARLTLVPTFLPMALLLLLFLQSGVTYNAFPDTPGTAPLNGSEMNPGIVFLLVMAGIVTSLVTYCWAAVGWHRFVLLEEHGRGIVPQWHGANVMSYLGRAFLIGLLTVVLGFGGLLVVGLILTALPYQAVAFVVLTGFTLGLTWVVTRIGLILPAAALGEAMTLGESWNATRPVASDLLVPLFFIALAMTVASELIGLAFRNSALGLVPMAFLYWIQILLNLSLMTTLYGTQIQGRPLN